MAKRETGGHMGAEGQVRVRRLSSADLARAIDAAEDLEVPVLLRAGARYDGKDVRATVTAVTPRQGREVAATVDVDPEDAKALKDALDALTDAYAGQAADAVRRTVAQDLLLRRGDGGQGE